MKIVCRLRNKFFIVLFFILYSALTPAFSQSSQIEPVLKEIEEKLKKLNANVTESQNSLSELSKDIKKVDTSLFRLDDGTIVVGKDQSIIDQLKRELEAITAKKSTVDDLEDAIHTNLRKLVQEVDSYYSTKLQTNKNDHGHQYVMQSLVALINLLKKKGLEKSEKELEDSAAGVASLLPALIFEAEKFRKTVSGNTSDEVDELNTKLLEIRQLLDLANANTIADDSIKSSAEALEKRLLAKFDKLPEIASLSKISKSGEAAKLLSDQIKVLKDDKLFSRLLNLPGNDTAYKRHVTAKNALDEIPFESTGLVVRILEAKVGDTFQPSFKDCVKRPSQARSECMQEVMSDPDGLKVYKADRWCNATANLAAACDRESKCPSTAALTATYQSQMCGGDPSPTGSNANYRGMYVMYDCVRNLDKNFVGKYPASSRDSKGSKFPERPEDEYVIMRQGSQLVCK